VASIARSYPETWTRLTDQRSRYAALSEDERERYPGTAIPLPVEVFDFYKGHLKPRDRIYFQVLESGFGAFADLPTVVRVFGHYYLLPAVTVRDLEEADVVVSWEADPGLLELEYLTQYRAGLQLFFVSRIEGR
jgi:hypothetical protein